MRAVPRSGSISRSSVARISPCSSSFDFTRPERQPGAPHLRRADLAQQVRQAADVVLVAVGQDHRAHEVALLAQVRQVGQDEVDAEHLVAREGDAGVDHDDAVGDSTTVMFLPISPTPPRGMTRMRHARASRPRRSSAARTVDRSAAVAGTSGRRGVADREAQELHRGLDRNGVRGHGQRGVERRAARRRAARARSSSPASIALCSSSISSPATCEATQMPPHAADLAERDEQVVVAGVEREPDVLDDAPGLVEVGGGLLHGDDVVDLARAAPAAPAPC